MSGSRFLAPWAGQAAHTGMQCTSFIPVWSGEVCPGFYANNSTVVSMKIQGSLVSHRFRYHIKSGSLRIRSSSLTWRSSWIYQNGWRDWSNLLFDLGKHWTGETGPWVGSSLDRGSLCPKVAAHELSNQLSRGLTSEWSVSGNGPIGTDECWLAQGCHTGCHLKQLASCEHLSHTRLSHSTLQNAV